MAPTAKSHDLACPPPPFAHPPIVRPASAWMHADSEWVKSLGAAVKLAGASSTLKVEPKRHLRPMPDGGALLWWTDEAPPWARTIEEALSLAESNWIAVTLGVFAQWLHLENPLRFVRSRREPPGARVTTGCFLTNGFALLDVLEWFTAEGQDSFVQRRLQSSRALTKFLESHHFQTVLTSSPQPEKETAHPLCLFHAGERGGLLVADPGPMLQSVAEGGFLTPASIILLQWLGLEPTQLGQFTAVPRNDAELCSTLGELVDRYPLLEAIPRSGWSPPPAEAVIYAGQRGTGRGTVADDRPMIVIRTGFSPTDYDAIYGVMHWLKQLLRHEPYVCPYRDALLNRYRVVWLPRKSEILGWDGAPTQVVDANAVSQHLPGTPIETWLDICGKSTPGLEISWIGTGHEEDRLMSSLPSRLSSLVLGGQESAPNLSKDPDLREMLPSAVAAIPKRVVRVALPVPPIRFDRRSILKTDLVAQLVELIAGMSIGLVAVNRRSAPLILNTGAQIQFRPACLHSMARIEQVNERHAGEPNTFVIPPACCYLDD